MKKNYILRIDVFRQQTCTWTIVEKSGKSFSRKFPVEKPPYPLIMADSLLLKMAIEIVDLPSYKMVISSSNGTVYQRVHINILYLIYPMMGNINNLWEIWIELIISIDY